MSRDADTGRTRERCEFRPRSGIRNRRGVRRRTRSRQAATARCSGRFQITDHRSVARREFANETQLFRGGLGQNAPPSPRRFIPSKHVLGRQLGVTEVEPGDGPKERKIRLGHAETLPRTREGRATCPPVQGAREESRTLPPAQGSVFGGSSSCLSRAGHSSCSGGQSKYGKARCTSPSPARAHGAKDLVGAETGSLSEAHGRFEFRTGH